uniref:adenylate cyclase n=1 Tax=Ascaris lumbricoides TaxID=6252 RepID=A0A0M3IU72_ASCLU
MGHIKKSVMFASIPNFKDFWGQWDTSRKLECLRLLNEIICEFDKLLSKPKFSSIEKIKTVASTYMAAAGLNEQESLDDCDFIDATDWGEKKKADNIVSTYFFKIKINSSYILKGDGTRVDLCKKWTPNRSRSYKPPLTVRASVAFREHLSYCAVYALVGGRGGESACCSKFFSDVDLAVQTSLLRDRRFRDHVKQKRTRMVLIGAFSPIQPTFSA